MRMSKSILRLMEERESTRTAFDPDKKITQKGLNLILEAARWAPTAHNMQNFQILAIDDVELLQKIGEVRSRISETFLKENYQQFSFSRKELARKGVGVLGSMFPPSWRNPSKFHSVTMNTPPRPLSETMQGSPLVLIVVYDPRKRAPASTGDFLGIISLGCVMENIWLAAQSLGISVQIMSIFSSRPAENDLKRILGIPKFMKIAYAMRLGYPGQRKEMKNYLRVRRDMSTFAHSNRWSHLG